MNKYLTTSLIAFILVLTFCSCEEEDHCLIGSGTADSYPLQLSAFSSIRLLGPVNLEITQGTSQSVVIDAVPEMWEAMTNRVTNGEFVVGFEDNVTCFDTDLGVWVRATVSDISRIRQAGISEIRSNGDLELGRLILELDGESVVVLSGSIDNQVISVAGITDFNNFDAESLNTVISLAGEGDFEISCSDELDLSIAGVATVKYKGNPQINQNVAGTLNLVDAN